MCANSTCQNQTTNAKYCSRSCAGKVNATNFPSRKTQRKCIWCGGNVPTYRDSRCRKCQDKYNATRYDYIQELTLESYWNRDSIKHLHASSRNVHIRMLARSHFKDLLQKPCAKCGYNKHVELHHIKPISSFSLDSKVKEVNSYDNLIQLCPNCHWEMENL